jgi:hypothetical protein
MMLGLTAAGWIGLKETNGNRTINAINALKAFSLVHGCRII